jgi:hypothetical protein
LIATTIFELLRSDEGQLPTLLADDVKLKQGPVRSTLELWNHRKLFNVVNRLFDSTKGNDNLPAELQNFGEMYNQLVEYQTYKKAMSCPALCSTVAVRYD